MKRNRREYEKQVPDGCCKKSGVFLEDELGKERCRNCYWLKSCEEQIGSVRTFYDGQTEVMGYRIEKVDPSECSGFVAYRLHGKRGAVYSLVRNQKHPHQMFIINGNMNVCSVKGNYWFSDENGELVAVS